MNDVVFYNMWGRERYQDYINLPFKYKEEHEWVTDFQKNNAYFWIISTNMHLGRKKRIMH